MLDTHGRKYFDKWINIGVEFFYKIKWKPNTVTRLGFIIGALAGVLVGLDKGIWALIFLWISGYLDAIDGGLARKTKQTSEWGTIMDIAFDRLVEISFILGLAFFDQTRAMYLLFMTTAIIFSLTIFLTVGSMSSKKSKKSFYYQAGFMERTEGFIMFTLMILLPSQFKLLAIAYGGLVYFTGCQRLLEARDLFD